MPMLRLLAVAKMGGMSVGRKRLAKEAECHLRPLTTPRDHQLEGFAGRAGIAGHVEPAAVPDQEEWGYKLVDLQGAVVAMDVERR